jgi:cytochrome c peroxidase
MMKIEQSLRAAGQLSRHGGLLVLLACAVFNGSAVLAQEQSAAPKPAAVNGAAYSMARMMDPNAWAQMMTMSMDPRIWMNPISSCAACHDNEDVGRYQQVFGPFVAGMMNPAMMTSPGAYNEMMATVFDKKAAEHWQRAVEKKYGLNPGDPLPVMHGWPWGMAPPAPVPPPAQ